MIRVVDDAGRDLSLPHAAERIVSLVPSLTETICELGCTRSLVAVTRHCTMPAAGLETVRRIGGTKNPDIGAILDSDPDLVIVNSEENRKDDFEALTRAGLNVFVTYPRRVADVPDLLRRLGQIVGSERPAATAAAELEHTLAGIEAVGELRRVFCPIWKNPWMTFNAETFADDLLSLVVGQNVFGDRQERYFEIALEEVAAAQPDVILLPDEPYVFGRKDLAAMAPLSATPAWRDERIYFVDGKALFWFGTRTVAAIPYLREIVAAIPA